MNKLKVLVNAYACSPDRGSEPGMGWNWCIHLAKYCELHIITEEEFKPKIEEAITKLPQKENLKFYYNPVSEEVREMARNQGDWRFYTHYKKWQKKTLEIAKQIISEHNIDIMHQLNMIGFREPGYLWKIGGIPFVWGPIGGLKQFPVAYLKGAKKKTIVVNRLKNIINILQLKYDIRVNRALRRAQLLVSSIPDSQMAIKKHKKLNSIIIPETGTFITDDVPTIRFLSENLKVLWVGKFDYRKQLPLALKSLAETNNKKIILNIYGGGNESQVKTLKKITVDLNITNQVIWHGSQPNINIQKAMRKAHLLFFTSVSEDTSTVVLEAISNRLPVLCFDTCGFGAIINNAVGRKVPLTNPHKSVSDFAKYLNLFHAERFLLEDLSTNCKLLQRELSWDEKAKKMFALYNQLLIT